MIAGRKRTFRFAATAFAASVFVVGGAALFGRVSARDNQGDSAWDFMRQQQESQSEAPQYRSPAASTAEGPSRSRPHGVVHASNGLARHAVCVRLCDGYFFPMGNVQGESSAAGQESTCAGLCPGAPTHVYLVPSDGDGVAGAMSREGHPYSALPVALRYTKTVDNTCSCKRSIETRQVIATLTQDVTLRRGDVVMTPKGLLVFNGSSGLPYERGDFATLAEARARIGNADARAQLDSVAQLPPQQGSDVDALPSSGKQTAVPVTDGSSKPLRVGSSAPVPISE